MVYRRTIVGERWHSVIDGKAVCGVPSVLLPEERTEVEFALRCWSCDQRIRKLGRAQRPKKRRGKPGPKVTYLERFKEKFE